MPPPFVGPILELEGGGLGDFWLCKAPEGYSLFYVVLVGAKNSWFSLLGSEGVCVVGIILDTISLNNCVCVVQADSTKTAAGNKVVPENLIVNYGG